MSRMFQSFARPRAVPSLPVEAGAPRLPADAMADDGTGPGWYESSRDLLRGLVVQELVGADEAQQAMAFAC